MALTFTRDLERWTGIPDARLEGNIVNRNHDDNLTTKRLQDPRVSFNDLSQESWGGGSITRLGWLTFARSFDDRRLTWRIGMMNKVQTFDQIIPCDFQLLTQCGGKSANSLTRNNWNIHTGHHHGVQADADGHPERRGDGAKPAGYRAQPRVELVDEG